MDSTVPHGLANRQSYLHNWIDDTSQEQEPKLFAGRTHDLEANDCLTIRFYDCCVRVLQKICHQLSTIGPSKLEKNALDTELRMLQEELARLYLCGDGFADGEMGMILDHANELRDNLLEILCEIGAILIRGIPRTMSAKLPDFQILRDEDWDDLIKFVQQAKDLIVVESEDEVFDSDDEDESKSVNNEDESSRALKSHVQMIMDLIPTIESTIEHQRTIRLRPIHANASKFQASGPAQIYISLVQDKFPKASVKLQERLGEANWQRHLNIRLRMEQVESHRRDNAAEKATKTGSLFQPQTLFHDSGIGTTIGSHSQYARTEASHTSFISSIAETEKGHLRVPPTPIEVGAGAPFRCQLCGIMQTKVKNRIDWKRHVFQDVLPYICTFPDCKDELRQFATRQAWADHEFNEHRMHRMWSCPKCQFESSTSTDWLDHLRDRHQQQFSESLASAASATACRKISKPVEEEKCLLCDKYPSTTRRALVAHIGKHMEEVAMMALPKDHTDDSGQSSESDDSNFDIDGQSNGNSRNEHTSFAETIRYICPSSECSIRFDNEKDFDAHVENHERPFQCHCGKRFTLFDNYKSHYLEHQSHYLEHVPEPSPTGPRSSSWQDKLQDYCRRTQKCSPVFNIVTDRRAGRTAWSSTVTIEGNQVIVARFWYDGQHVNKAKEDAAEVALQQLMRDPAENPYHCEICETRFRRLHDLKRHHRTVHKQGIHVCSNCGQSFPRAGQLVKHIRQSGCASMDLITESNGSESEISSIQDSIDEKDLSSKPRCQRCINIKKGCDRQRPCQRCKDAGIGPEGCMPESGGGGRKGRFGKQMGVSVGGDCSFHNVTNSNHDDKVQNLDDKLSHWPPDRGKDDGFLTEVENPDSEPLPGPTPASATYAITSSSPFNDDKAHCDMCTKTFSGTRRHRESNLKRHMNDIHQLGLRLPCTEPGCSKKCGRADNLRSHRLKVHGIDDSHIRSSNSTRQKKSAERRKRTLASLT
ncbi:MAG: hypothetical protein Q9195_009578 [Heterodermia aff. obscurata]